MLSDIQDSFKEALKQKGMSASKVSKLAGYSASTLNDFLNDRYIMSLQTLFDHAQVLDIELIVRPQKETIRYDIRHTCSFNGKLKKVEEVECHDGPWVKYIDCL